MTLPPAPHVARVDLLETGDRQGNHGLLRLTTPESRTVFALGIPQGWSSRTGPTWVYLVEEDGWTMVDAGDTAAFRHIQAAMGQVGLEPRQVRRVIITHGHWDHDGGVADVQEASSAEVWAHEAYEPLKALDLWRFQHQGNPMLLAGQQQVPPELAAREQGKLSERPYQYVAAQKRLRVTHPVWDGRRNGHLLCWQTPGHSPDELTIRLDGLIFTGDHVLPEITPHPSVKLTYPAEVQARLPEPSRDSSTQYGLGVYLRSLARVAALGQDATVLPAHRLFNKHKLNLVTAERAQGIIEHHLQRMNRLVSIIGIQQRTLHEVTTGLFQHRQLDGGNYYSALSEAVAHLEFMADCGDLALTAAGKVAWLGTERYREAVSALMPSTSR